MKIFILSAAIVSVFPLTASAGEKEDLCGAYGTIASSLVNVMLPETFENVIAMINGTNPELSQTASTSLIEKLSEKELASMSKLNEIDLEALSGAAGQVGFTALISGQVNSGAEIKSYMQETCMQLGPMKIIKNQKAAEKSIDASMGK